jgi:hypothetical protein
MSEQTVTALDALRDKDFDERTDAERVILSAWSRGYITEEGAQLAAQELRSLRAAVGRLEGERQALRGALEAVQWEHEYSPDSANANESGFVVRCAFCDVLRDDVQSGADKHTDGCKVVAALAADGERGTEDDNVCRFCGLPSGDKPYHTVCDPALR